MHNFYYIIAEASEVIVMSYFDVAAPLPKNEFLNTFMLTVLIGKVFLAPLGLPQDEFVVSFGDPERAIEHLLGRYRVWEDVLSRRLYAAKGISDERVNASLYFYAEKVKDVDVLEALHSVQSSVQDVMNRARFTDISCLQGADGSLDELGELTVSVAKKLLTSLREVVGKYTSECAELDQRVLDRYGVRLPKKVLSAGELSYMLSKDSNFLSAAGLTQIENAFVVSVQGREETITLDQFYMLLDYTVNSKAMDKFLIQCGLPVGQLGLNMLRCGCSQDTAFNIPAMLLDADIVLALQETPEDDEQTLSYLKRVQPKLNELMLSTSKLTKPLTEPQFENPYFDMDEKQQELMAHMESLDKCTVGSFAGLFLKKRTLKDRNGYYDEEQEEDVEEDVDDEVEDEDVDEEELQMFDDIVLPAYSEAALLANKAECLFALGDYLSAIDLCNQATELCDNISKAYSVRAKAVLCLGIVDDHNEEGGGDDKRAISDALAAFLLGGSQDLTLAAVAEEVAKESCKTEARRIFAERQQQKLVVTDELEKTYVDPSLFPKLWFINAFYDGYDPLDQALDLQLDLVSETQYLAERSIVDGAEEDDLPDPPTQFMEPDRDSDEYIVHNRKAFHLLNLLVDEILTVCDLHPPESISEVIEADVTSVDVFSAPSMKAAALSMIDAFSGIEPNGLYIYGGKICLDGQNSEDDLFPLETHKINKLHESICIESGICSDQRIFPTNDKLSSATSSSIEGFQSILSIVTDPEFSSYLDLRVHEDGTIRMFGPYISHLIAKQERREEDTDVEISDDSNSVDEEEKFKKDKPVVCPAILARLLNCVSSIAFLAGDAAGALGCLRASVAIQPTLFDSVVKLSSMLAEMDELDKASWYMDSLPTDLKESPVFMLHQAEILVHKNQFDASCRLLRKAQYRFEALNQSKSDSDVGGLSSTSGTYRYRYCKQFKSAISSNKDRLSANQLQSRLHDEKTRIVEWRRGKEIEARSRLSANIHSLLGVSMFRSNPNEPDVSYKLFYFKISHV